MEQACSNNTSFPQNIQTADWACSEKSCDQFWNLPKKYPKIPTFWHFAKDYHNLRDISALINLLEHCFISKIWAIEGISMAYCREILKLAKRKKMDKTFHEIKGSQLLLEHPVPVQFSRGRPSSCHFYAPNSFLL